VTNLTKLYDRLTPEERFRAFVSAVARRDMHEADRLNDTCPQRPYRIDEPAYTQAKLELHRMAMVHRLTIDRLDTVLLTALIALFIREEDFETYQSLFCSALEARALKVAAWSEFCRTTFDVASEELEASLLVEANPLVEILLQMLLKSGVVEHPELAESAIAKQREAWDFYWRSRRDRW
jgi:hypothetical protein